MAKEVVKVSNLSKSYGSLLAVDDVNIVIEQGEIYGLIGPNGAGKSTTIECVLGVKQRDTGSTEILGMDPSSQRRELFKKVGVQFQSSFYPEKIKVKEICEMIASLYPKTINYFNMLDKFSLSDKSEQMVDDLSGGEKQKLSVILALLHEPEVVFLDELTTGLDPSARREVWSFLKSLKELGLTIFLTSHYMDEVHFLCDRVSIIRDGKLLITASPDEIVKESAKSNLEEAYLYYIGEDN